MEKTLEKILVIDDDKKQGDIISELLNDYDIEHSLTASEGIERANENSYSLITVDYNIGDYDNEKGPYVVEQIRKNNQNVPIIMYTGFDCMDRAVEALHSGVDNFIKKGNTDTLKETALELMGRTKENYN